MKNSNSYLVIIIFRQNNFVQYVVVVQSLPSHPCCTASAAQRYMYVKVWKSITLLLCNHCNYRVYCKKKYLFIHPFIHQSKGQGSFVQKLQGLVSFVQFSLFKRKLFLSIWELRALVMGPTYVLCLSNFFF